MKKEKNAKIKIRVEVIARLALKKISSIFILSSTSSVIQSCTLKHQTLSRLKSMKQSKLASQTFFFERSFHQESIAHDTTTHLDSLFKMSSRFKRKKRALDMFDDKTNTSDITRLDTLIRDYDLLKNAFDDLITLYVSLLFTIERLNFSLIQESRMIVEIYEFLEKIEKVANHSTMRKDVQDILNQMFSTHEETQTARNAAQAQLRNHIFEKKLIFDHQSKSETISKNPPLELTNELKIIRVSYEIVEDLRK